MKDTFKNLKSKKYFLLCTLVTVLNSLLAITLLQVSFGQTKNEDFSSQQPVKVETVRQKKSPLQIMIINVDNSPLSYQNVIYSLQNTGNKSIRAYTLLADGKSSGKVITNSFAAELFQVGKSIVENLPIERQNIKEGETVFLSFDYVEFEDGSTWGNDSAGKSKSISGEREGRKLAIKQLKDLIKNQNVSGATSFLRQEIQDVTVNVLDENKSEEWKKGFRLGYKSVISILQKDFEQSIESFAKKLDKMEKVADSEGKDQ